MFLGPIKHFSGRLKRRLFAETAPGEPTAAEAGRIELLRQRIRSLPPLEDPVSSWSLHRKRLRDAILERDPRRFPEWEMVRQTMYYEPHSCELRYLKGLPQWPRIRSALMVRGRDLFPSYRALPGTNGNLVHLCHSLWRFLEFFSLDIEKIESIFEFGGGYGGMCHLSYRLGFGGSYTVFDFPEMLSLQDFYLASQDCGLATGFDAGKTAQRRVALLSDLGDLRGHFSAGHMPELCIATWSLSETPLPLRRAILETVQPRYWLLAFQERYAEIDNKAFFEALQGDPRYRWSCQPIPHLKGNYFLFGERVGGSGLRTPLRTPST